MAIDETNPNDGQTTVLEAPAGSADEPIVRNAGRCTVCGASADRMAHVYQCTANSSHFADLFTGIFDDHSYPGC